MTLSRWILIWYPCDLSCLCRQKSCLKNSPIFCFQRFQAPEAYEGATLCSNGQVWMVFAPISNSTHTHPACTQEARKSDPKLPWFSSFRSSYSEYSTFGADLFTSSPFAAQWREYRTVQKAVQTWVVQNRSWNGQEEGRRAGHLYKHSSECSVKLHVRTNFTHQPTSIQKQKVHTWCKPWNTRVLPFFKGGPHLGHKKILSI